jgi:hypothetical protein
MLATQGSAHDLGGIAVVVVLIATMLVVFWRTVVKVALALFAIAVIAIVGFGAVVLWQAMHHVVR